MKDFNGMFPPLERMNTDDGNFYTYVSVHSLQSNRFSIIESGLRIMIKFVTKIVPPKSKIEFLSKQLGRQ